MVLKTSSDDDLQINKAKRTEAKRSEPKRSEPKRSEAKRSEAKRSETKRNQTKKPEKKTVSSQTRYVYKTKHRKTNQNSKITETLCLRNKNTLGLTDRK